MGLDYTQERYVRLYTRDTLTWRRWTWQTRACWCLLLRRVDRAGLLDLHELPPEEAVALTLDVPLDVATRAFDEWSRTGSVELVGTTLVVPRFLEAQEAERSGAARTRAWRERRVALVRATHLLAAESDDSPPAGDDPSRRRDAASPNRDTQRRGVTGGDSLPCCAVPCSAVNTDVESSDSTSVIDPDEPPDDETTALLRHWRSETDRPTGSLTSRTNRRRAKALIRDLGLERAMEAVSRVAASPHHAGRNDTGTRYDHWRCNPLKSPEACAQLLERANRAVQGAGAPDPLAEARALAARVLRKEGAQ